MTAILLSAFRPSRTLRSAGFGLRPLSTSAPLSAKVVLSALVLAIL